MATPYELAQVAAQNGLNEREQAAALKDFLATGGQNLDPAATAWCAAFVNATIQQSGGQGTNKLNARSFLDWGQEVKDPQKGDVAVFSRGDPNGWQGHVGFFDGYNEDGTIRVLGGNQGDAVNVSSYDASRLLGFRRGGEGQPAPNTPMNRLNAPTNEPEAPDNALAAIKPPQFKANYLNAADFMTQNNNQLAYAGFDQNTNPFLRGM